MQELRAGVFSWRIWRPGSFKGVSFNGTYLVQGEERVVVDPPPLNAWELEHLEALGPPTLILVTNANHFRAAPQLKARYPSARLLVPAADRDVIFAAAADASCVDGVFHPGEVLAGLEVIGLADQKTAGESALYDPVRELVVLGDALIGTPAGSLSLLPAAKYADPAAAREGLRVLCERPLEALILGDGEPVLRGARAALQAFFQEVPEVPLVQGAHGLVPEPSAEGWFVLNLAEAQWLDSNVYGVFSRLEGVRGRFQEIGVNVTVVEPGQAACLYHRESAQEGFLVLSGECLLIVEEQERMLRAWDYFHCPPGVAHVCVGAGSGPAAILMLGARPADQGIEYPPSALAAQYDAAVRVLSQDPEEAYAQVPGLERPQPVPFRWPPR